MALPWVGRATWQGTAYILQPQGTEFGQHPASLEEGSSSIVSGNTTTAAWGHPEQRTQLSGAWTSEQWKWGAHKGMKFLPTTCAAVCCIRSPLHCLTSLEPLVRVVLSLRLHSQECSYPL